MKAKLHRKFVYYNLTKLALHIMPTQFEEITVIYLIFYNNYLLSIVANSNPQRDTLEHKNKLITEAYETNIALNCY